jgi:hypothetical protein
VLQSGEVGGSMIGTDAAFIIAEDHVHHPVEAILHRPVAAGAGPSWWASNTNEVM